MKNYLYVYSNNTFKKNEKEVLHTSPSWELKKSTIYKEAEGRKILTVYLLDEWLENRTFVERLGIN